MINPKTFPGKTGHELAIKAEETFEPITAQKVTKETAAN